MRGGHREGAGRKPGLNNRVARWPVRWTEAEEKAIEFAAYQSRKTPSEYIRESTLTHITGEPMPGKLTDDQRHIRQVAHAELKRAIRNGLITKTGKCIGCASDVGVQMHLDDYAKPMEPRELCKVCHMAVHKQIGAYAFKKQFDRAAP